MKKYLCVLILFFCGICHTTSFTYAEEKILHINNGKTGTYIEAVREILSEAYRQIGIKVVYDVFPSERALMMSNNGSSDGEMFRIDNMSRKYPNLIKVPVAYIYNENSAFSTRSDIQIDGYPSLKPYFIGFHTGFKEAEDETIGMKRVMVTKPEQAFIMLDQGRVDVVIEGRFVGLELIRTMNLHDIKLLTPPVSRVPLYHYLHKKHKDLVPEIAAALQNVVDSGFAQKVLDDKLRTDSQ